MVKRWWEAVLLTVTEQRQLVVVGVGGVLGRASVHSAISLAETSGLLSGSSESPSLAVGVDGAADPVDSCIPTNGLVLGIHKDDLVVNVGCIL